MYEYIQVLPASRVSAPSASGSAASLQSEIGRILAQLGVVHSELAKEEDLKKRDTLHKTLAELLAKLKILDEQVSRMSASGINAMHIFMLP
jgi:hypothetical protein